MQVRLPKAAASLACGLYERYTTTLITKQNIMTQQKPAIGLTGATGFIGGFILSELLNQEYTINVLIRDRKKFEGQIGNKTSKVCILTGSLEDKNVLKKLCKGSEIIIHCAAKVGDWGAPEEYERTNIQGTHELLKNCLIHKIQQFIYMSSMAVYGLGNFSNIQEDQPILPAKDPYNNSKAQTELLVQDFCKKIGSTSPLFDLAMFMEREIPRSCRE
jgi:nucleoside-diphosphate-sugar epimerase